MQIRWFYYRLICIKEIPIALETLNIHVQYRIKAVFVQGYSSYLHTLIHYGRDQMAATLQTIFSC